MLAAVTCLSIAACFALAGPTLSPPQGASGRLTVEVDKPGVKISPTFYGLMTEEINHSYDGGLYAELIQNRAFSDNETTPRHWALVQDGGAAAEMKLVWGTKAVPAKPTLKLHVSAIAKGQRAGIANDGYWGVPVLPNTRYRGQVDVGADEGSQGPLDISLESNDGKTVFARARIDRVDAGMRSYNFVLRTGRVPASSTNRLVLAVERPGDYTFGFVSLFPPTFRNQPNGFRPDLMKLLGEMNPTFLRLPGGNYLEGNTISERFLWLNTVGDIKGRPGHQGPWGYRSSDGLGLLEFLEWCEDLKMQPVLAVYAGYSLRGEHVEPGRDLEGYVQDAIDEIEFVIGDKSTKGIVRGNMGHPKPFPLTYVEIGNEDQFDRSRSYDLRFAQFYDAIKARFPQLKIIATMPVKSRVPDVVDDHYYRTAAAMERDVHHYDRVDRNGPKIFVGEWASTQGRPTPTMEAALGDAAWLTGLEKNSDLVVMEAYAPLLVNVNPGASQWPTNLIGYDAVRSFGSPSFYVQTMFGQNAGDVVLPVSVSTAPPVAAAPPPAPHGMVGLGTYRTNSVFRNILVSHNGERLFPEVVGQGTTGWTLRRGAWTVGDGILQQTSDQTNTLATVGDPAWTNYTYRVQARKVSGAEGFFIQFHVHDRNNFWQWNVGGWEDTRTALQRVVDGTPEEVGPSSDVTVKPGHWYDVRIELRDGLIRCYLDEKLVTEATETPPSPPDPVYATASRDLKTGDVILKVVNVSSSPENLDIDLKGALDLSNTAQGWELSGQPGDVNTVDEPKRISPKPIAVAVGSSTFLHTFPPYSVTVLRVPAKAQP